MISAKEAEKMVGEKLNPKMKISWPFSKEMVFVPDHLITYPFFKSDHCYVLVHAGFSFYRENEDNFSRNIDPYGDYSAYAREIKRLIRSLGSSNELSLFFVEYDEFKKYPIEFLPSGKSLMVFTKGAREDLVFLGDKSRKNVEQSKIYSFLKEIGVNEVRIGGEYAWCNEGEGCVRFIGREFEKRGFEIKGIKGCLYPSFSPPPRFVIPQDEEYEEVTRKIFKNQVEFAK
jgi:hypothetical protein